MKLLGKHAILLAIGTAVVSGVANFVSKIAVTAVKDPIVFTFLKNGIVAILLISTLIVLSKWKEIRSLNRRDWTKLLIIGIVGGSIPFVLYFTGLTMTSAVSASFIHKTMFIWVAMLAVPFLKERLSWLQGAALLLLVFGNLALLGSSALELGMGELLIFGATLFWAVENIVAKRVLASVSSSIVATSRMVFGSTILLVLVLFQGKASLLQGLSSNQWMWTLLISALLFAYVLMWFKALSQAPATIVTSVLVPASLITTLLSNVFLNAEFTTSQLVSGSLFITALALLTVGAYRAQSLHGKHEKQQHI